MADDEPISRLDESLDELVLALGMLTRLEDVIAGMRAHEQVADQIGPDFPGAVDVLAGTQFRRALIKVAGEVLALRQIGADDGNTA